MPELIVYVAESDANAIRMWINADPDIAWIIKDGQQGCTYRWRATKSLDHIRQGSYTLWHTQALRLNVPSGSVSVPDAPVLDPFKGWTQTLESEDREGPWFGANLPGPALFEWREAGRERPDSLGRSGFHWLGNRYASIGKPAHPSAVRWWKKLKRYVKAQAVPIPWPSASTPTKHLAYAFPEALVLIRRGRHFDVNP